MPNFDGENELRIFYTVTPTGFQAFTHVHTIDVRVGEEPTPGQAFSAITVDRWAGASASLATVVDEYVALIQPTLGATSSIDRAELWLYPPTSEDGIFISTYAIAEAGTGTGNGVAAHQITITYRSINGGVMRTQFMEGASGLLVKDPYPSTDTALNNLAAYVISDQSAFQARDNSRPFVVMNVSGGGNEKLFRKRYRQ